MTDPGPLHPEVQALFDAAVIGARLSDGPGGLAALRASYVETADALGGEPEAVAEVVEMSAGGVPIRVYVPVAGAGGVAVIYMHGGGWVTGDLPGIDRVCRHLALASGRVVCSVGYRLAPENRFPAAVDDVLTALAWMTSPEAGGRFGHDTSRIVVAGDSAGANLAAVAALREPQLVAGQLLIYPALDATLSGDSYTEFSEYGLSRADMQAAYRGYLGDADPRDPEVSPLLAGDLSSAPPAWVVVASHDVLRDDGMRYVARLREAGVAAELTIAEGLVHGFIRWGGAVTAANAALDAGAEFVRRATVN